MVGIAQLVSAFFYIINCKMCLPLPIQFHQDIAGLPSLLAGVGKASRIQNHNILILLQIGPVGMAESEERKRAE